MTSSDRLELRADVGSVGVEPRTGARLSKLRDGRRTWVLWLLAGEDPAELRATMTALVELDLELERAYTDGGESLATAPRIHPRPRLDDDETGEVF
jgi:hypothetical protein